MKKTFLLAREKISGLTVTQAELDSDLAAAVSARDLEAVEEAAHRGGKVSDSLFFLPPAKGLGQEALNQTEAVFRYLIKHGANINGRESDTTWDSPLDAAMERKEISTIIELHKLGGRLVANSEWGTCLHLVVQKYPELIEPLCKGGIAIDATNNNGETAVMAAYKLGGYSKITRQLLYLGANPAVPNKSGDTLLHLAVRNKDVAMIETLLNATNKDAIINAVNNNGETALAAAYLRGDKVITDLLLILGASPAVPDKSGDTLLHVAVRADDQEMVGKLATNRHIVNQPGNKGKTPLMLTYCKNGVSIAKKLIDAGADVNAQDPEYKSGIFCAALRELAVLGQKKDKNIQFWHLLLENGAELPEQKLSKILSLKDNTFKNTMWISPPVALRAYAIDTSTDKSRPVRIVGDQLEAIYAFAKKSPQHFDALYQVGLFSDDFLTHMRCEIYQNQEGKRYGEICEVLYSAFIMYGEFTELKSPVGVPGYRTRFPECKDENILKNACSLVETLLVPYDRFQKRHFDSYLEEAKKLIEDGANLSVVRLDHASCSRAFHDAMYGLIDLDPDYISDQDVRLSELLRKNDKSLKQTSLGLGSHNASFMLMMWKDPISALLSRAAYRSVGRPMTKDTELGNIVLQICEFAKISPEHFDAVYQGISDNPHGQEFLETLSKDVQKQAGQPNVRHVGSEVCMALHETFKVYAEFLEWAPERIPDYRERFPECSNNKILDGAGVLLERLEEAYCRYELIQDMPKFSEAMKTMVDMTMNLMTQSMREHLKKGEGDLQAGIPTWRKNNDKVELVCFDEGDALRLQKSLNTLFSKLGENYASTFSLERSGSKCIVSGKIENITFLTDVINKKPNADKLRSEANDQSWQIFIKSGSPDTIRFSR